MGPIAAMFLNRDPEDMKETHLSPERERAVMALRHKLAAGDTGGPISLDSSLPEMPPPEHALMGGFYQQPMGAAPPTMPFRPPGQGMSEPPPSPPAPPGMLAQYYRGR